MAVSVTLPALGESVTEGTVTRWLKQVGDQVQVDEPLLEVSTDKVDTEIPAPVGGVLLEIKVGEDETVEVGSELAVIGEAGEAGGAQAPAERETQPPPEEPAPQAPAEAAAAPGPAPAVGEQPAPAPSGTQPASAAATTGTPITLPALGESVTEGTVTRWLKQVGDQIETDEPLLEVSTDKVDTEIPAPTSGVLLEIKVNEDETVAVGTELAIIGAPGTAPGAPAPAAPAPAQAPPQPPAPAPAPPAPTPQAPTTQAPPAQPAPAPAPAAQPVAAAPPAATKAAEAETVSGAPYVTPLVRKLAAEHEIDLSAIKGTGVGGRIRKQDVLAAAETARQQAAAAAAPAPVSQAAPAAAPAAAVEPSPLRGKTEKMSRLRSLIARRMVESLQTSAQLTSVVEVDVTAIARLRERAKRDFAAREGAKLSFLPFFAKATVEALKQHPVVNATINSETNEVTYFDVEHLGIAVDTEHGLIVPVIKDAGDLNIAGLARKIADLADRTRSNKITPDELSGGTFTITNTGSRGALFDTPIINQPQVGVLGTGAVVKRAVVIDDPNLGETIAVRSMVYLALTYDHRLVDGAEAARFLETIKQRLEHGGFEGELGL